MSHRVNGPVAAVSGRDSMETNPETTPIVNIEGELVSLGPLDRSMLPLFQRWINDFNAQHRVGIELGPMTLDAEERWYESASAGPHSHAFAIFERATMNLVGSANLHAVNYRRGSASFGIMIGELTARGKGYGTETATLMLDY